METTAKTKITVKSSINAPIEKVWNYWSSPEHITKWCSPSEEWHTPYAENDLKTGGKFLSRMAARDGSLSFDFNGVYDRVKTHEVIEYTIADGRKVIILFTKNGEQINLVETFEAESENPIEMQKAGWQAILNSFKKYVESN